MERKFSAAGKMHDDLKKAAKDDTLEASLDHYLLLLTQIEL